MSREEQKLLAAAQAVEQILEDLRGMVGPNAWQRIEALLQTVTGLYAAGLERLIDHAKAAGSDEPSLGRRLCDDELTASLLLLHGLHPLPTAERIDRALNAARPRLGHDIAVSDLDTNGVLTLRAQGELPTCPSSRASLEQHIADLVYESAPEVLQVRLQDATAPVSRLVQIDVRRVGREST